MKSGKFFHILLFLHSCFLGIFLPHVCKGTQRWSHTWLGVVVTTWGGSSGPVMTSRRAVNGAFQHTLCLLDIFLEEIPRHVFPPEHRCDFLNPLPVTSTPNVSLSLSVSIPSSL